MTEAKSSGEKVLAAPTAVPSVGFHNGPSLAWEEKVRLDDRYGTGLVFPSQVLNEPPLQGNECKDDPAVPLERKHLLFGVYCAQTEGFWFQLHLDYVSEEPEPSQVCSWGTVL